MKTTNVLSLLFSFFFCFSVAFAQSALKVNSIEFKANYYKHKGLILDVRSADEYASGHIEGSKNMNVEEVDFETAIDQLDKNHAVFVYSSSADRSSIAANILRKKGFKSVFDLNGGYIDLQKAGMKSVK